jgi:16S rRNA processing protein RimM
MGLLAFGKILTTHGNKGEIRVFPFSGQVENLTNLNRVFVQKENVGEPEEFTILRLRSHNRSHFLMLEGISSIEDAREIKGSIILIEEKELPQLKKNEYYWFQLIGLTVYTKEGTFIGKVDDLMERDPQTILIVKDNDKEVLMPMIDSIIKEIDLDESKVTITPIKGLID